MMERKIIYLLMNVVSLVSVFSSCSKDVTDSVRLITLTLSADNPQVRTFFSNGEEQVKWNTGDIISIVDDKGDIHVSDPLAKAVLGTATFSFPAWPSDRIPYYAVFSGGYDETLPEDTFRDNAIQTSVKTVQFLKRQNTFSYHAATTVGTVEGSDGEYSVLMRNICALVKVKVPSIYDGEFSAIRLEGSDKDYALSGIISVTPGQTPDKLPTFTVVDGSEYVTLSRQNGIPSAYYYFCVLPGVFMNPILTYVSKADGSELSFQYKGDIGLEAGKITDLSTLPMVRLDGAEAGTMQGEEKSIDVQLKVCSYNLWSSSARKSRIETGKDPDEDGIRNYADPSHYWCFSKGYVADNIVGAGCDIYGFQECCDSILNELPALLSARGMNLHIESFYRNPTVGDVICWNDNTLEMKELGVFWNNIDNPDLYKADYHYYDINGDLQSEAARSCVWAKMKVRKTGKEFLFFNTHGPLNDSINVLFSKVIVNKVKSINTGNLPFILLGDFNAGNADEREGEEGMMYDRFLDYWKDSRSEIVRKGLIDGNELVNPGTHVGYLDSGSHTRKEVHRIDHIFYDGLKIVDYNVNRSHFFSDGSLRYPSDHLPVYASYIFEN